MCYDFSKTMSNYINRLPNLFTYFCVDRLV